MSSSVSVERLLELYQQEKSVHKVGKIVGLNGDTVHHKLVSAGYKLRNSKWSEWEISALKAYYADTPDRDFCLEDAAKIIGRGRMPVALKANELGLCNGKRANSQRHTENMSKAKKIQWKDKDHPRGMAGKKHSAETRSKLGKISKDRWLVDKTFEVGNFSDASRQKSSDRMMRRQADPASGLRHGYSRGKGGRRADLGGRHFRSSWEANYARYLCWLQVQGEITKWEFEPDTFWFDAIKRGVRSYLPDFKVWPKDGGEPYYVEIKGYMDAKSRTKLKRMKKYHPNVTVKLVDAKLYKILDSRMRSVILGWEGGTRVLPKHITSLPPSQ